MLICQVLLNLQNAYAGRCLPTYIFHTFWSSPSTCPAQPNLILSATPVVSGNLYKFTKFLDMHCLSSPNYLTLLASIYLPEHSRLIHFHCISVVHGTQVVNVWSLCFSQISRKLIQDCT